MTTTPVSLFNQTGEAWCPFRPFADWFTPVANKWLQAYPLAVVIITNSTTVEVPDFQNHSQYLNISVPTALAMVNSHVCSYGITFVLNAVTGYLLAAVSIASLVGIFRVSPSFQRHIQRKVLFFLLFGIGMSRGVYSHVASMKISTVEYYSDQFHIMWWFFDTLVPSIGVGDLLTAFVDILLTSFWLQFVSVRWAQSVILRLVLPMGICFVIASVALILFGLDFREIHDFEVHSGNTYWRLLAFLSAVILGSVLMHTIVVVKLLYSLFSTQAKLVDAADGTIVSTALNEHPRTSMAAILPNSVSTRLLTPSSMSNATTTLNQSFALNQQQPPKSNHANTGNLVRETRFEIDQGSTLAPSRLVVMQSVNVNPRIQRHLRIVGIIGFVTVLCACVRGIVQVGYMSSVSYRSSRGSFDNPMFTTVYYVGFMNGSCLAIAISFCWLSFEMMVRHRSEGEDALESGVGGGGGGGGEGGGVARRGMHSRRYDPQGNLSMATRSGGAMMPARQVSYNSVGTTEEGDDAYCPPSGHDTEQQQQQQQQSAVSQPEEQRLVDDAPQQQGEPKTVNPYEDGDDSKTNEQALDDNSNRSRYKRFKK